VALHRTRQADAERLCRKLQRPLARRVSERAPVRKSQRGSPDHRGMEDRLQHQPTAHEPQRAHTDRVCNPPLSGAEPEQTLLINEGKQGSRSIGMSPITSANQVAGNSIDRAPPLLIWFSACNVSNAGMSSAVAV